jgi:hypothetical protein
MTLIARPGQPHFARAFCGMNYTLPKHSSILARAVGWKLVRHGPHCRLNHYYPYRSSVISNMMLFKPNLMILPQQRTEMRVDPFWLSGLHNGWITPFSLRNHA